MACVMNTHDAFKSLFLDTVKGLDLHGPEGYTRGSFRVCVRNTHSPVGFIP